MPDGFSIHTSGIIPYFGFKSDSILRILNFTVCPGLYIGLSVCMKVIKDCRLTPNVVFDWKTYGERFGSGDDIALATNVNSDPSKLLGTCMLKHLPFPIVTNKDAAI